jgi:hypothetical protein
MVWGEGRNDPGRFGERVQEEQRCAAGPQRAGPRRIYLDDAGGVPGSPTWPRTFAARRG